MPTLKDIATAMRLAKGLLRSRRDRRAVRNLVRATPPPRPASIEIAVYFADSEVNLYQVRQWYAPLAELAASHPVAIISRSPSGAVALFDESPVPVVYLRKVEDLETFVEQQPLRIVFYVNQNSRNFQMMRYAPMWHVFINHGESDKMYMTTNQFKAYDYAFVAGDAARDRLRRKLWGYDLDTRTIAIGRPQTDHLGGDLPFTPDDRTVVLYAPTWEGDRSTALYGSIASHGIALVSALIATGRHRVVYRPHPRSGVLDPAYAQANRAIIAALESANARDPRAQHVVDRGAALGWQLSVADVAITDISAMVYDRLATGRPLVVTRPSSPSAHVDLDGYLGDAEWLDAGNASAVVAIVDRVLTSTDALDRLAHWVTHHFGDTSPGASTARFHAAVERLFSEWETQSALHPVDPAGDRGVDDEADD